ncbi:UDP-N-acetylmuramate dehydrogenase [Desulfurivibrio sp. D14AmB]|uniref:UDP-N-acetylmuramate dehydrogenase n=1 Tax=Desulfurivibrio sp. D14AmB TaxID=3374370 RepID=UPI00376F25CF
MSDGRCGKAGAECQDFAERCPLFSANWPGELRRKEPLAPLTTLRVGGPAAVLARPGSIAELETLLALLEKYGCPRRVLGRGSNLLVADRGYGGVVILLDRRLGRISRLEGDGAKWLLRVEAGCSLAALLGWAQERGLGGLEFLVGIPGSVGGAAVMNAGAWGEALGARVQALELVGPGGRRTVAAAELRFSYRRLEGVDPGEVIAAVILALAPRPIAEIRARMRQLLQKRRASQPRGVLSAGSFFKNPPGDYAGRLIEAAGLKGLRVGGAMVAREHANFLINDGGATAADLVALMEQVRERVAAHGGVRLEPEVHLLGFA